MTREEKFKALAALFRDFTALLEEIPEERRDEVRTPFCNAAGHYLEVMEEVTDVKT